MSTEEPRREESPAAEPPAPIEAEAGTATAGEPEPKEEERLPLELTVEDIGPCKKRLGVTIPREAVDQHLDKALDELVKTAIVPGFRPGRAPRKLVQRRFRREVADQVRGELVATSLEQAIRDKDLTPVTLPELDYESIQMPDNGPLSYTVELEVRPTFTMPEYKGLRIRRLVSAVTEEQIERAVEQLRRHHGRLVPKAGDTCQAGDYVVATLVFRHGDEEVARLEGATVPVAAAVLTRYAEVLKLDEALAGARLNEPRQCEARLLETFEQESLRGQTVQCTVTALELKQMELPELTAEFLRDQFGMESVEELRRALREALERQIARRRREWAHAQVVDQLLQAATWDLPEDMVIHQAKNIAARTQVDLLLRGVPQAEVRARTEEIVRASHEEAKRQLKRFFVLDTIAEAEAIEVEEAEVDRQIAVIAANYGESPRRVRARLEKEDRLDMLRIQIRESKTLDRIVEYGVFEDVTPETLQQELEAAVAETERGAAAAPAAEEPPAGSAESTEAPPTDSEPKES